MKFGISLLPILVQARKTKGTSHHRVLDFVRRCEPELDSACKLVSEQREAATNKGLSRRDRLAIGRYFDLRQRSLRSYRLALSALEEHVKRDQEYLLDKALLQFETGERFRKNLIKMRIHLPGMLCNNISRAASDSKRAA